MSGLTDIRKFQGGMNKDISYAMLPDTSYTHAENFKLISSEGSNDYVLENAEGNYLALDLDSAFSIDSTYGLVGHCYISSYLVMWFSQNKTTKEPTTTSGATKIIRLKMDRDGIQEYTLLYSDVGDMQLTVAAPIKAVGFYENPDVIKTYWTDGLSELRYMNIMDPSVASQAVEEFSFIPKFPDLSSLDGGEADTRAIFVEQIDGDLRASSIQYTYQYYSVNGASTTYAPLSPPVIVPFSKTGTTTINYRGGDNKEQTGNGNKIQINIPATKEYDRIRLIALDIFTYSDVPNVRVFGEYPLNTDDTTEVLYFSDIGTTINEIDYETFLTFNLITHKAKDITSKGNILFASNIEEEAFDVEFDARAYRFIDYASGSAKIYQSNLTSYYVLDRSGAFIAVGSGLSNGSNWEIPEDADCINRYNDPDNEETELFIYQSDLSTLGATGPNVEVEIFNNGEGLYLDETDQFDTFKTYSRTSYDPVHPFYAAYKRSFERREVYRIGLILHNNKMQSSPVKWSCDLKMPANITGYEFSGGPGTSNVISRLLGIQITVNNLPDDVYAWQLVAVPRINSDKSVLFNAVMQLPRLDGSTLYANSDDIGSNSYPDLTTVATTYNRGTGNTPYLISPDINVFQNTEYTDSDFLEYIGYFDYKGSTISTKSNDSKQKAFHKLRGFTSEASLQNKQSILGFEIVPQTENNDQVSTLLGNNYSNYAKGGSDDYVGNHGTVAWVVLGNPLALGGSGSDTDKVPYVAYRRNIFESQYGGIDFYSRQRSEYIGISEIRYRTGASNNVSTFEGDTYIDYFWYLKQSRDLDDPDSWFMTLLFPVQSSMSGTLVYSDDAMNINDNNGTLMREISGTWFGEIDGDEYIYEQDTDLYQYNTVYSQVGIGKKYLDTLLDQSENNYYPNRVRYSETKEAGEVSDAFTVFKAASYRDVDGRHGAINNLINFKDQLYFWQDHSFGALSVDTRSLITDNNAGALALGTGGVLDRYDYLSTTTGNVNDFGIVKSNVGLYWIDNYKNEVYKFDGKLKSTSKIDGIQSWLNDTGKTGYVAGVYDSKYNDVIFTIKFSERIIPNSVSGGSATSFEALDMTATTPHSNVVMDAELTLSVNPILDRYNDATFAGPNNFNLTLGESVKASGDGEFYITFTGTPVSDNTYTVSHNERISKYVSFHSFTPNRYIECDTEYYSLTNDNELYRYNDASASRSTYFGTTYDSVLTTIFNKDFPYTKVYDIIKWISKSVDGDNVNQFKDTFSTVEMYNDYQSTGDRSLYYQHDTPPALDRPTEISRRERTWSMNVPRNIVDSTVFDNVDICDPSNWDDTLKFKERMRDKYMVTKFTYDNAAGNIFSVPMISTTYRRSYR
jgi:hypothetical protein